MQGEYIPNAVHQTNISKNMQFLQIVKDTELNMSKFVTQAN